MEVTDENSKIFMSKGHWSILQRTLMSTQDWSFTITSFRHTSGPPLWSSGQSFRLQIQRSRVRFPALPDFLSSSGSGTGSTQPREVN